MATSTLEVVIRGKNLLTPVVNQANASLSGLAKTASGLKGTVLTGVGLGAGIGAMGLATAAVGRLTEFLGDSVRAAMDEEAGIARLTMSLKDNVASWDGNTSAIEKAIDGRTRLAFNDDVLRSSFTGLVARTKDVNEAFRLQAVAMDIARFRNVDLEAAAIAVGKAYLGSSVALQRMGIAVKAGASGQEALTQAIAATQGQAEAYAGTTLGKMEAATIRVEQAQERLGKVALPLVAGGMELAAGGLDFLITALQGLASPLAGAAEAFDDTTEAAFTTDQTMRAYSDGIYQAFLPAAALAIEAQGGLKYELIATQGPLATVTEDMGGFSQETLDAASAATEATKATKELGAAQKWQAAQAIIAEWNAQAVGDAYDRISNAANLAAERTDALRRTQEGQAYTALIASTGAWTQSTAYEALNKGLERAGLGASATDERIKKLTTSEGAKGATARSVTKALDGETASLDKQAEAAKRLQAEIDAINAKGKGPARWSPDDPKRATGGTNASITIPTTTPSAGVGTTTIRGADGRPITSGGSGTASALNAPPASSPAVVAPGVATPVAAGVSFAIYLDGRTIAEVVNTHLGRMAGQ